MRKDLATFVQDFTRHGHRTAIVTCPGNRRVVTSYEALAQLAGRFSRMLSQREIKPGDRVLLWGANSAEWVAAFFGCVLRGVIAVPLDAAGSVEFAARVIADVSPRLIVGDENLLQKLPPATPRIFFENFAASLPLDPLLAADPSLGAATPLQILYTSGTTSAPKGIVHTHGNVLSGVEVLEREINKYRRYLRWVHPLRILHTLPLSHVFGQFMGLWVPPLLAAPVHYEDRLAAGHLIARIRRERISVAAVVPRLLQLMRASLLADDPGLQARLEKLQHRRVGWRWWHLRHVHRRFGFKFWAFVSGGAALPSDVEQFWNTLGFVLVQGYGMTETTALATLNHPLRPTRGSIGRPLAGREVRIAEDGEILLRGAMLAAGTWSRGALQPRMEDWLRTGDLGVMDADGQMRFLGRKSDVIVSASGMNIHPADLESSVRAQPAVRDCVVVGWDGPLGPVPVAAVILRENFAGSGNPSALPAILADILNSANRALLEFQQVHAALLWPAGEFPRSSMGKLLRQEVSAWVRRQMLPAGAPSSHSAPSSHDPLLRVLALVTGSSTAGVEDSASLAGDLHLDSLGRMQLAMAIEEQFGVPVDDEAIAAAGTVADLRALLRPVRENSAPATNQEQQETPDAPFFAPATARSSALPQSPPRYPRWPWAAPVQAMRVLFLECVLRPLVALLAHPRVVCGPAILPAEPSLYVCNHVTAIDVALVLYALPRRVRWRMSIAMSAELLAQWRRARSAAGVAPGPLRWLAPLQAIAVTALFNVFPLPAGAGLRQSFAHAGEALDRGYNLLVFPEGKRTLTGQIQPFHTGISLLAEQSRVSVVPIALAGLWSASQSPRLASRLAPRFRPARLAIVVGAPLRRWPAESHAEFAARLRAAVAHLDSVGAGDQNVLKSC